MKKKHCIWILLLVLTSCTERKITPLIVAYESDSIKSVTYRIQFDKIQEWKYSSKENYEESPSEYQEYVATKQFIDSLKVWLPPEQDFNTGRIYDMKDSIKLSEFIIVFGDSLSIKNIVKVTDSAFIERSNRILNLIKRQKCKIMPPVPKSKTDSILMHLHVSEPIRIKKR